MTAAIKVHCINVGAMDNADFIASLGIANYLRVFRSIDDTFTRCYTLDEFTEDFNCLDGAFPNVTQESWMIRFIPTSTLGYALEKDKQCQ